MSTALFVGQLIFLRNISPRVDKRVEYLHSAGPINENKEFATHGEAAEFAQENNLELVRQPFNEKAFDSVFGSAS